MKKVTPSQRFIGLIFMALLVCGLNLQAADFFTQDFSADTLPNGWSTEQLLDTNVMWTLANDAVVPIASPSAHNGFAYIENKNNVNVKSVLISPAIDCSGKEKVILNFYAIRPFDYQQTCKVYVNKNDSTWILQSAYSGKSGKVKLNISATAAKQAHVKIKWEFESYTSSFWGIDDITLSDPVSISSIKKIEDINTLYGTPLDKIPFPKSIIAITENGEGLINLNNPAWSVAQGDYLPTTPGTYTFQLKSSDALPAEYNLAADLDSLIKVNVIVDASTSDLLSIETPAPLVFQYAISWWQKYITVQYTTSAGVQSIEINYEDWDKENSDFDLMKAGTYPVSIDVAPFLPTNVMVGNVNTNLTMDWVVKYKGNIDDILVSKKIIAYQYSSDTSSFFLPKEGYLRLDDNSFVAIDLSNLVWVKDQNNSTATSHTYTSDMSPLLDSVYSNNNNIPTHISCTIDYSGTHYFTLKMAQYWSSWDFAKLLVYINGEFRGAFAKGYYQNTFNIYAHHKDSISIYYSPDWNSYNYSLEVSSITQESIYSRVGLPDDQELLTTFLFLQQGLDHDLKIKAPEQKWTPEGKAAPLSLNVKNEGNAVAADFNVSLMLLNKAKEVVFSSTKQMSNDTILPGKSLTVEMDAIPDKIKTGQYDLLCQLNYPNDENPFNNESTDKFNVVKLNYPDNNLYFVSYGSINSQSLTYTDYSIYNSSTNIFSSGAYIDGAIYLIGQDNVLYIMDDLGNPYQLDSIAGLDYSTLISIDGIAWNENTNTAYLLADYYSADTLYTINMSTLSVTKIGALKAPSGGYSSDYNGMSCDKNGVLYTSSYNQLFSINMSSLETTKEMVFSSGLTGFDFDTHNNIMVGVLNNNGELFYANIADSSYTINQSIWGAPFPILSPVTARAKKLDFKVNAKTSNTPIANAAIDIYPQYNKINTDQTGQVSYYVYSDEININLDVEGYGMYKDTLNVTSDASVDIELDKAYQVVWVIKDAFENDLDYLNISINGQYISRDQYQRFVNYYANGKYTYTINSYRFGEMNGTFEINGKDTLIELYLEPDPIIGFNSNSMTFSPAIILGINESEAQSISISNNGGEAFYITDIQLSGKDKDQFNIDFSKKLPIAVYASDMIHFNTVYVPDEVGEHNCEVIFTTNRDTTLTTTLTGVSYLPYKTPYAEDFERGLISGAYWNTGKTIMTDSMTITDSGSLLGNNPTHWWINNYDSTFISLFMVGDFTYDWLISPVIDLEEGSDSMVLNFDFSLETSAVDYGADDRFMVVVSYDYGKTWLMKDTLTLFDNDTIGNVFAALNNIDTTFSLSLAGISGPVVFGFYGESTVDNTDNYLVVDNIRVYDKEQSNGLASVAQSPELTISPNPTSGLLKVGKTGRYDISIYNLSGHILMHQKQVSQIDISHFKAGIYLLHVETNDGQKVMKVIKK